MNQQLTGYVIFQSQDHYRVLINDIEMNAILSGRYRHEAQSNVDLPLVGDQVYGQLYDDNRRFQIMGYTKRRSLIQRRSTKQQSHLQPLAANIETLFIVTSANKEFNEARLQRYLAMAWESGANPVIILSKIDLISTNELTDYLNQISAITFDSVPVMTTGANHDQLAAQFASYLAPDSWVGFVGSSGVGKSTLIKHIIGDQQLTTRSIRSDDDKGRHTTTSRQAYRTPSGAFIVDTPGMRELGMTSEMGATLNDVFTDIETFAQNCRFNDCQHNGEPGCAVAAAIETHQLTAKRLSDYQKLKIEAEYSQLSPREIERAKVTRLLGSLKTRPGQK